MDSVRKNGKYFTFGLFIFVKLVLKSKKLVEGLVYLFYQLFSTI